MDCNYSNFPQQGNVFLENVTQGALRVIQNLEINFWKRSFTTRRNQGEEEEENEFNFDSNVPDTSHGAEEFIPDVCVDLQVKLLKIPCSWKLLL